MKQVGWILLGLSIGWLAGRFSTAKTIAVSTETASPQEWAQSGVQEISEEADPKKQLAAAEAYYGKAVVLFLASIVNRVTPPALPAAQTAELAEPIVKELAAAPEATPAVTQVAAPAAPLTAKEKRAQEEAQKTRANLDRMLAFRKASAIDKLTPQIRKFQGRFLGQLKRETGKRKGQLDKVEANFDFGLKEGKLQGVFTIILSSPEGEEYSRSLGDGGNSSFRAVNGEPNKVYLEPAPGDFIVLDIRREDVFRGDYYDSGGGYVGKVEMWRR